MTKTTEAIAYRHGPDPYQVFDIACRLMDYHGKLIDEWVDKQELWIEPPDIAVRRTRTMDDGTEISYEDRGKVNERFEIVGKDGFGGEWKGHAFIQEGVIYVEGRGGKSDFIMTSWTLSEKEQACLRVLDVKQPVAWLTPKALPAGRYWIKTVDILVSTSTTVPEAMKKPLR